MTDDVPTPAPSIWSQISERHAVRPDVPAARTELAADVRDLLSAVAYTDVASDDLDAARAAIAEATTRLQERQRPTPTVPSLSPDGREFLLSNPVDGPLNPMSPPLEELEQSPGHYVGRVCFRGYHEGPPGRVHGGWTALILDHALARACLSLGCLVMTRTLEVSYRRGTPYDRDLEVTCRADELDGTTLIASGEIRAADVPTTAAVARFAVDPGDLDLLRRMLAER